MQNAPRPSGVAAPAPAGADASPESSATATPIVAISTPVVLRAVSGSTPRTAPTTIVSKRQRRQRQSAARRRCEDQRSVEQDRKQAEEQKTESGDACPVLSRRPFSALHERNRHKEDEAEAEPERADRQRIDRVPDRNGWRRSMSRQGRSTASRLARPRFLPSTAFRIRLRTGIGGAIIKEWNLFDASYQGLK